MWVLMSLVWTFLGTEKLPENPLFVVSTLHVEILSKISVINSCPSDDTVHT